MTIGTVSHKISNLKKFQQLTFYNYKYAVRKKYLYTRYDNKIADTFQVNQQG